MSLTAEQINSFQKELPQNSEKSIVVDGNDGEQYRLTSQPDESSARLAQRVLQTVAKDSGINVSKSDFFKAKNQVFSVERWDTKYPYEAGQDDKDDNPELLVIAAAVIAGSDAGIFNDGEGNPVIAGVRALRDDEALPIAEELANILDIKPQTLTNLEDKDISLEQASILQAFANAMQIIEKSLQDKGFATQMKNEKIPQAIIDKISSRIEDFNNEIKNTPFAKLFEAAKEAVDGYIDVNPDEVSDRESVDYDTADDSDHDETVSQLSDQEIQWAAKIEILSQELDSLRFSEKELNDKLLSANKALSFLEMVRDEKKEYDEQKLQLDESFKDHEGEYNLGFFEEDEHQEWLTKHQEDLALLRKKGSKLEKDMFRAISLQEDEELFRNQMLTSEQQLNDNQLQQKLIEEEIVATENERRLAEEAYVDGVVASEVSQDFFEYAESKLDDLYEDFKETERAFNSSIDSWILSRGAEEYPIEEYSSRIEQLTSLITNASNLAQLIPNEELRAKAENLKLRVEDLAQYIEDAYIEAYQEVYGQNNDLSADELEQEQEGATSPYETNPVTLEEQARLYRDVDKKRQDAFIKKVNCEMALDIIANSQEMSNEEFLRGVFDEVDAYLDEKLQDLRGYLKDVSGDLEAEENTKKFITNVERQIKSSHEEKIKARMLSLDQDLRFCDTEADRIAENNPFVYLVAAAPAGDFVAYNEAYEAARSSIESFGEPEKGHYLSNLEENDRIAYGILQSESEASVSADQDVSFRPDNAPSTESLVKDLQDSLASQSPPVSDSPPATVKPKKGFPQRLEPVILQKDS